MVTSETKISLVLVINSRKYFSNISISSLVIQGIYGLFYPKVGRNLTNNARVSELNIFVRLTYPQG